MNKSRTRTLWYVSTRPDDGESSFAARLDHLFTVVHPPDRGEYSYREVAESIERSGGPTISASYIWQLRTGVKDNPTKRHIEALAAFFGVGPTYFFDDTQAARVDAELALVAAMRDAGIRQLALRATGLSTESLNVIADLIERTRRLEGLDRKRKPATRPPS